MNVLLIFGTRPEAIKLAPEIQELRAYPGINPVVCVTAQHRHMLDQVLSLFKIQPDYDLNIMRANQSLFDITKQALSKMEMVLRDERPDLVLVQGDTTTAFVGALASFYQKFPVGHVEAGLRTYNKYSPFPEEMNRLLIDHLADLCFVPTGKARQNSLREGVAEDRVFVTGNTVVDALLWVMQRLPPSIPPELESLLDRGSKLSNHRLILVTGHRRESFGEGLENICRALCEIVKGNRDVEIIYSVHLNPNVREPVSRILENVPRIHLIEPLGYLPFVQLMRLAYLVLSDSGGIQEEAPTLGKPVLVMRSVTERSEGIEAGAAKLVGTDVASIVDATQRLLDDKHEYEQMARVVNPYGDGKAAKRIVDIILEWMGVMLFKALIADKEALA